MSPEMNFQSFLSSSEDGKFNVLKDIQEHGEKPREISRYDKKDDPDKMDVLPENVDLDAVAAELSAAVPAARKAESGALFSEWQQLYAQGEQLKKRIGEANQQLAAVSEKIAEQTRALGDEFDVDKMDDLRDQISGNESEQSRVLALITSLEETRAQLESAAAEAYEAHKSFVDHSRQSLTSVEVSILEATGSVSRAQEMARLEQSISERRQDIQRRHESFVAQLKQREDSRQLISDKIDDSLQIVSTTLMEKSADRLADFGIDVSRGGAFKQIVDNPAILDKILDSDLSVDTRFSMNIAKIKEQQLELSRIERQIDTLKSMMAEDPKVKELKALEVQLSALIDEAKAEFDAKMAKNITSAKAGSAEFDLETELLKKLPGDETPEDLLASLTVDNDTDPFDGLGDFDLPGKQDIKVTVEPDERDSEIARLTQEKQQAERRASNLLSYSQGLERTRDDLNKEVALQDLEMNTLSPEPNMAKLFELQREQANPANTDRFRLGGVDQLADQYTNADRYLARAYALPEVAQIVDSRFGTGINAGDVRSFLETAVGTIGAVNERNGREIQAILNTLGQPDISPQKKAEELGKLESILDRNKKLIPESGESDLGAVTRPLDVGRAMRGESIPDFSEDGDEYQAITRENIRVPEDLQIEFDNEDDAADVAEIFNNNEKAPQSSLRREGFFKKMNNLWNRRPAFMGGPGREQAPAQPEQLNNTLEIHNEIRDIGYGFADILNNHGDEEVNSLAPEVRQDLLDHYIDLFDALIAAREHSGWDVSNQNVLRIPWVNSNRLGVVQEKARDLIASPRALADMISYSNLSQALRSAEGYDELVERMNRARELPALGQE